MQAHGYATASRNLIAPITLFHNRDAQSLKISTIQHWIFILGTPPLRFEINWLLFWDLLRRMAGRICSASLPEGQGTSTVWPSLPQSSLCLHLPAETLP